MYVTAAPLINIIMDGLDDTIGNWIINIFIQIPSLTVFY